MYKYDGRLCALRACVRAYSIVCALVVKKLKQLHGSVTTGYKHIMWIKQIFLHEIEIYHRLSTKYSLSFGLHSSLVSTSDYAHAVVITACRCEDHLSDIS